MSIWKPVLKVYKIGLYSFHNHRSIIKLKVFFLNYECFILHRLHRKYKHLMQLGSIGKFIVPNTRNKLHKKVVWFSSYCHWCSFEQTIFVFKRRKQKSFCMWCITPTWEKKQRVILYDNFIVSKTKLSKRNFDLIWLRNNNNFLTFLFIYVVEFNLNYIT